MPQDWDDFQTKRVRGLPDILPEGEEILWQGQPNWWALTRDALAFWWVAGFFATLFAWRTVSGAATQGWADSASAASLLLVLGAVMCVVLLIVGLVQAKFSIYTITNRRVVLRIGAMLTITLNLPLPKIVSADLDLRRNGTGTIALEMAREPGALRVSYLMTWPHVRPWHVKNTAPALRCIPEAESVARLFAEAAEMAVSSPVITAVPAVQPMAAE